MPSATQEMTEGATNPKQSGAREWLKKLGPGLITGASDDDPSGIATYSQAGAAFAYGLLWTMLISLPLMSAVQEISARLGRITGHGIAGNIRRHYSVWLLYPIVFLLLVANIINIGADIGAMGDVTHMIVGGPGLVYCTVFALATVLLQIYGSYAKTSQIFKILTLALIGYIVTTFLVDVKWLTAFKSTIVPHFERSRDYWATVVAVLGTTISPYLFFWQASLETEEINKNAGEEPLKRAPDQAEEQFSRIRLDTYVGMTLSNVVAFFIIVAAAATLNAHDVKNVDTSAQAAEALRPIAGRAAMFLFAAGIIGTGLLAVPVLAGSAAYAVGEAMRWPTGMDRKPHEAKGFYSVITLATVLGLLINVPAVQRITHLTPITALFWSAVINGVVAVPIMVIVMLMSQSRRVLGEFERSSRWLRVLGWLATVVMACGAVLVFVTWKS